MKCPHRLEPHQIQGLDFIHIYPVIQWLVKLAIATREEMGDYIRAFSESQFNKEHITPEVGVGWARLRMVEENDDMLSSRILISRRGRVRPFLLWKQSR